MFENSEEIVNVSPTALVLLLIVFYFCGFGLSMEHTTYVPLLAITRAGNIAFDCLG